MAKNKIGKLFDKTIVWGCSLNELDEKELLYVKKGIGMSLIDNNGVDITEKRSNKNLIPPDIPIGGKKEIRNTEETDVSEYATAQVVDSNLTPENIKNGVIVLGIEGEYTGEPIEGGEK